jgi:hypothetical protein
MLLDCNTYKNSITSKIAKLDDVSKTFLLFVFLNANIEIQVKNSAISKLII